MNPLLFTQGFRQYALPGRVAWRFYQPVTGICKGCSGSSATCWPRATGLSCKPAGLRQAALPKNVRGPVGSFASFHGVLSHS